MPDERTLKAYERHAADIARRYAAAGEGVDRYFGVAFPPGSRVLDIGAGSGRDMATLVAEGRVAYGIEPSAAMREQAIAAHPSLAGRLVDGALPASIPELDAVRGPVDGVLCSGVLQHLARSELFDAVFSIRRVLKPSGRALISVPVSRGDLDEHGRDSAGRFFNRIQAGELELLFQRVGFRTLGRWESGDSLGRGGVRWATCLFEAAPGGEAEIARPLDRIEGVLRQDRKVATYKLALMRALASIATTQSRTARFRPDGWVAVPITEVAELWIDYYWPLFEAETFLPQMNGELGEGRDLVGFASELQALIARFRSSGGLRAFRSARASGELDGPTTKEHRALTTKLRTVIRSGPVQYAGRSSGTPLFAYERGYILVEEALWQELSLMSHWIEDSLVVRWAELSRQLATAAGHPGAERIMERSLRILLDPIEAERQTDHARMVFEGMPDVRCVWSNRPLTRGFDVDHVIPFRLWHSNALWNLLPAAPSINNEKRDKLPERTLLLARRPVIQDYWSALRETHPTRFDVESSRLAGQSAPDLDALFEAFAESIEVTAIQRGCQRWSPR